MMKIVRCPWVNLKNSVYVKYHDQEWGRPVHDDRIHFEFLTLEGAQAGLSWETILKKRPAFSEAFSEFDPVQVSRYSQKNVERLLKNEGIVRNRLKIQSTISNAKAFLQIQREFGSFDAYVWRFVEGQPKSSAFQSLEDYPATTPESDALSKDLKRRGFRFVGPTIMYAYMQAVGLVEDHTLDCFRKKRPKPKVWEVYMIRTRSGKLYTGITTDLGRRLQEHKASSRGAKFFRTSEPLEIVYREKAKNRSVASQREAAIKRLPRAEKLKLSLGKRGR